MKYTAIFFFALFSLTLTDDAFASCGSATCPLDNHRHLRAGWLHIGIVHEYINQDQIYIGSKKSFVGAIRYHHDEVQTINQSSIIKFQASLSGRLGVNLEIPFISRQHSHIHHHQGQDLWESWNFSGLGDIVASGQFALLMPSAEFEPYLSILAGLKHGYTQASVSASTSPMR